MKRFTAIFLILLLSFSVLSVFAADLPAAPSKEYPQKFWDVPKDYWAFGYIAELADRGVLEGHGDGSFQPEETVTRAEWAKMMVIAGELKIPVDPYENGVIDPYFVDVGYSEDWFWPYVSATTDYLSYYGPVPTYSEYTGYEFKPNQAIVREDVTVSLVKLKGYDVNEVDYSCLNQFSDPASISNSLKAYVAVAVEKNLITGFEDGTFRGQDTLTRAEAAALLWRAFQYGSDNKITNTQNGSTASTGAGSAAPVPQPSMAATPPEATPPAMASTPRPTPQITPAFTPTATPVPQKPYKLETLQSVELPEETVDRIIHRDNLIYYLNPDSNRIMQINIADRRVQQVIDCNEIAFTHEDMMYELTEVHNIYYDDNRKTLMLYGDFMSAPGNLNEKELRNCLVTLPGCKYIGYVSSYGNPSDVFTYAVGTTQNGHIMRVWGSQFSLYEIGDDRIEELTDLSCNKYDVGDDPMTVQDTGTAIYVACFHGLRKYDYTEWSFPIEVLAGSYGLTDSAYYIFQGTDRIVKSDFNGNEIYSYTLDDVAVLDGRPVSFQQGRIDRILYVYNEEIVFYDYLNNCFRILSPNN